MNDKSWQDMPPGRERQAARARYYADRGPKPIAENCFIKKVTIGGKTGIRGPSRVVHFYDNEALEQIATLLARTRAQPFPSDLLNAELCEGQLVVSCKSRYRKVALPATTLPRAAELAIEHLSEAELETRNPGTSPQPERENECTTPPPQSL